MMRLAVSPANAPPKTTEVASWGHVVKLWPSSIMEAFIRGLNVSTPLIGSMYGIFSSAVMGREAASRSK